MTNDLIERMRLLEVDHEPDGWPAVQMRDISALCDELDRRFGIGGELIAARREIERLRNLITVHGESRNNDSTADDTFGALMAPNKQGEQAPATERKSGMSDQQEPKVIDLDDGQSRSIVSTAWMMTIAFVLVASSATFVQGMWLTAWFSFAAMWLAWNVVSVNNRAPVCDEAVVNHPHVELNRYRAALNEIAERTGSDDQCESLVDIARRALTANI